VVLPPNEVMGEKSWMDEVCGQHTQMSMESAESQYLAAHTCYQASVSERGIPMNGKKIELDNTYRHRQKIVGVMGTGDELDNQVDRDMCTLHKCTQAGTIIAELQCHLLTGGGRGVMEAVSKAFVEVPNRCGRVIGVIRAKRGTVYTDCTAIGANPEYQPNASPNDWVEIAIFTHLPYSGKKGKRPLSRNHINVLSSDVVVVMHGGTGTQSEAELAVDYGKRVILFGFEGRIHNMEPNVLAEENANVEIAGSKDKLREYLEKYLAAGG
jgi:predicted Rossmann-fold nucleotide-binding protein